MGFNSGFKGLICIIRFMGRKGKFRGITGYEGPEGE
jgi:hypothetical protein